MITKDNSEDGNSELLFFPWVNAPIQKLTGEEPSVLEKLPSPFLDNVLWKQCWNTHLVGTAPGTRS